MFRIHFILPLFLLITLRSLAFCANSIGQEWKNYPIQIVNEKGDPMPGVSVFTDDFKRFTAISDNNGQVNLPEMRLNEFINFTFIGYSPLRYSFQEIQKSDGIIRMLHEQKELTEVVVLGRRDDVESRTPYYIQQISSADLSFTESQTAADALEKHGNLFIQKSQMGGGSPVIRGFEANRILLVSDGVKMNNAIYRSGHLQNVITIDNGMLERIEIIHGPGSLMYGSDALGGVIHFRSKDPTLSFEVSKGATKTEGSFYSRYASANEEKSLHADINFGKEKWASLTSLTFTDFDDLRAGGRRPKDFENFGKRTHYVQRIAGIDRVVENVIYRGDSSIVDNSNVQIGTAYAQFDLMQKLKFQPSGDFFTLLNFQYSTGSDIPRYDNLTELLSSSPTSFRWAEWYYGPQKRLLVSGKVRWIKSARLFDRATLIGAFQKLDEDRYRRRFNNSLREFGYEDVWVYSLTLDFDKALNRNGRSVMMYGFDYSHNRVSSEAGRINIVNGIIDHKLLSRYPAAANRTNATGLYGNYRWTSRDSTLNFDAGLRFTYAGLFSQFTPDSIITWPVNYIDPGVKSNHTDLTWAVGVSYSTPSGFSIRALGSKAFRSPNLDDFSQMREQNGFMTIPNPGLNPEKSYNAELSLSQEIGEIGHTKGFGLRVDITGYYTWLDDFIVRRSFPLPNGSYFLPKDMDSLQTLAKVNAESGYIFGSTTGASLYMGSKWELNSQLSFTKGRTSFKDKDVTGNYLIDILVPAAHIPPIFGQTSLTFKTNKWKISAVARYQGEKPVSEYAVGAISKDDKGNLIFLREGTEDNLELSYSSINSNGVREYFGTQAWATFNLYSSWTLTEKYALNLALENIFDIHYRPFASGLSGPGRNIIVSFRASFSNK